MNKMIRKIETKKMDKWLTKIKEASEQLGKQFNISYLICAQCNNKLSNNTEFFYYVKEDSIFICENCIKDYIEKCKKEGFDIWIATIN